MTTISKSKNVLLVGSSFSAIPIFSYLEQHAFNITVCGALQNDPCHQYTENSIYIDYSNKEELLALIAEQHFNFIVPSCNDYAYLSCAWAAEHLGFPGFDSFETTQTLHSKDHFRIFTETHGFPAPKALTVSKIPGGEISLNYPLLLKPVDSFSGRGVTKVTNQQEFEQAKNDAFTSSRSEEAIVEEFVEGELYSHSAFIKDGQIIFDVFADEFCTIYPYQVNCSNIPSSLNNQLQQEIRDCIAELILSLKLCDGLLHTQLIIDGSSFWIIECMRRAPGDLYGRMVHLATGIDYFALYTQAFVGHAYSENVQPLVEKFIARHTISSKEKFTFLAHQQQIPGANYVEQVSLKTSGEILEPAPYDKAGIVFAEFSSKNDLYEKTPELNNYIKIIGKDRNYDTSPE